MKKLLPGLMVFGLFLGSAGKSMALPECTGSPANFTSITASWADCLALIPVPMGTNT